MAMPGRFPSRHSTYSSFCLFGANAENSKVLDLFKVDSSLHKIIRQGVFIPVEMVGNLGTICEIHAILGCKTECSILTDPSSGSLFCLIV